MRNWDTGIDRHCARAQSMCLIEIATSDCGWK